MGTTHGIVETTRQQIASRKPSGLDATLLPSVSSYGGGVSYPTSFVGDSEPSVGLSDPAALMRLAARVRGVGGSLTIGSAGRTAARADASALAQRRLDRREAERREHSNDDGIVQLRISRRDDRDDDDRIDALSLVGL